MAKHGFTIVELLIVIVVIGILAAITVVAYNGIQTRAKVAQTTSELAAINKAIMAYYAVNGSYPPTPSTGWLGMDKTTEYIPGLTPEYMSNLPQNPVDKSGATYSYRSSGTNYKLIAHTDDLCTHVKQQRPELVDPLRDCWAYGYWSAGATGY